MRKILLIITTAIALSACDQAPGFYPRTKCQERNVENGNCIKAEYTCAGNPLLELTYYEKGQVRCNYK